MTAKELAIPQSREIRIHDRLGESSLMSEVSAEQCNAETSSLATKNPEPDKSNHADRPSPHPRRKKTRGRRADQKPRALRPSVPLILDYLGPP